MSTALRIPLVLHRFTRLADVPAYVAAPGERFDSKLQVTVRADGTPRSADTYQRSNTCGGEATATEYEMMDVFPAGEGQC
ncbi:hypothetical protein CXR04_09565 [Streptomyces sp. CMB-StM0423]|nr:hypothetical protein CXR04_09565 [Streptomyces sp. CMB-StM0423]